MIIILISLQKQFLIQNNLFIRCILNEMFFVYI